MPEPVRLKIGVASGYCSLGDWGGGGRLEYTVIGHPVNLASRLEGQAGAGEVLVCERTGLLADVPLTPVMERPGEGSGASALSKGRVLLKERPELNGGLGYYGTGPQIQPEKLRWLWNMPWRPRTVRNAPGC